MADTEDIVNEDKLYNYLSVLLGLRYIVYGLQDFVTEKLRFKHMEISQKCTLGRCQSNCSRKFGKSFVKWCDTCKHWKLELHRLNRYSTHWDNIKWNKIDNIDFPQSFEEMGKVFVKDLYPFRRGVLKDFSALLSLIRNANLFNINSQTIDEMLRIRNLDCAHNTSVELHEQEKIKCLNVFVRFLKIPEINCTIKGKYALQFIETLRLCQGLPENICQTQEGRLALIDIQNEIRNGSIGRNTIYLEGKLEERLQQVTGLLNKRRKYFLHLRPSPKTLKLLFIPVYIFICLSYWYVSNPSAKEIPKGCLSMQFKDNWNIDSLVDFNFYVENLHNQSTVSRNWLFGKIYEELATSEKGVILTAEMGYGKSSIVSNIVCADQTSDWYGLRRNVLAYHFCRYDSIRSKNAAYFIRNIASAIVKHYPELGNLILSDDIASDILYGLRCSEDPIPCLENAILNPLQNKWKNYQFLIVLDALDECDSADKNNILQLLFKEIDNFPSNIKFIFTSRNIERVLRKFKGLNVITLSSFSNENGKDITEYIGKISHFTKFQMTLLTNVAQGNFLHVKLYLESCEKYQHCDFRNIPSSLEKIYQMNLERAFDTQPSFFEELRPIFEVLCTMTKPMKEELIFKVANISPEKRRKAERMIGNELGHFIITTNGYLSFLHKSIPDFLTAKSRKHLRFFVDKENGYKLFGAYLLNLPYISKPDLVDVVHHVAMSRNDDWKTILIQNYSKQILNFTNLPFLFYLHEAVTDFNSYATTNLLLNIMQYINYTDDRHMSAAFIAASHGNEQALKCLLDYGADPYFKVLFSYTQNRRLLTDIVHRCKYVYFCGYNILHIASQNGHILVVKMLVERFNDVMLFTRNDMNLTAFDLAAENGHFEIAAYLLSKHTSFGNVISLHHAAENGHSNIVRLLLQYGLTDTCVPCNGSIFWIPKSHGRRQQDYTIKYANFTEIRYTSFYDDWYLITCDTALNAAVRNGHMDVVKLLLNEATNTLKCTAFDGKTPIMTAVQYNQNTVQRLLLNFKTDFTARCRNENISKRRVLYNLGESELHNLTRERCANGMSIMHLLVVHWNFDTFHQLMLSGGCVNLTDRDNDQSTPLHYAFCHSNYEFVQKTMFSNLSFTIRSKNGSTPYHSAAICKSLILQKMYMSNHSIPDVKDRHGLSILQYGSLLKYSKDYPSGTKKINGHFHDIFRVALDSKHNLYHTDVYGRNFLHYAATNGNYFSIKSLFKSFAADINIFLSQKDNSGHTPVDELFTSMPKREINEPIKVPINCTLFSVLYSICKMDLIEFMTPHEIFIFSVFSRFKEYTFLQHLNITNYLTLSIHKRRLYPIFILNAFAEDEVQKVITTIPEIYDFLAEFDGQNIPKIKLSRENAINCNGIVSPFHKIIQNDKGKFWMYSNTDSLSTVLNDYLAKNLDFCVDNKGYNVLQRAAMGGNIAAVKYLIKKGMDVTVLSKKGYNLLHLGLLGAPVLKYDKVPLYFHDSNHFLLIQDILTTGNVTEDVSSVDFSGTLRYVLDVMFELPNTDLAMLKNQLCQSHKEKLGLLHLAAAKGFLKFLRLCKDLFGVSILNCRDSNDINPYYLAHIYNHDHITEWLDVLGVQMILPSPEVESILLYNIVINYKIRKQVDFTCRLHYRFKHMRIFKHVFKRCAKFDKHYVFLRNPAFTKVLKEHRTMLNKYSSWKKILFTFPHNLKYCLTQFNKLCSKVVSVSTAGMRMRKKIMRQFERRLRIIMTFGINDKLLFFQNIFKCHNVRPSYVESLSFLGLFKHHYRYTELLSVRNDIHSLWLDSYVTKLQTKCVDLKQMSLRFYEESGRNFCSNISKIFEIYKDDLNRITW